MSGLEEACYLTELYAKVVITDFEPEAHLLDLKRSGAALIALELFSPLVVVLAPVDYFSDWRFCIRRNFNKV